MDIFTLKSNKGNIMNGPFALKPNIFSDSRGFFLESWNAKLFNINLKDEVVFVQDNHSKSLKNTIRGLHYQLPPFSQSKLVRCICGEVYDVIVDIRKNSDTFKEWSYVYLSADNFKQLWVPEGFAHGFLTISNTSELIYKTTNYWSRDHERTIKWDDPKLAINWPFNGEVLISEKDLNAPSFDSLTYSDFF